MNPQQIVEKMIMGNSNPMLTNLVKMAQKGNSSGIEQFARNLCKQKGIDFAKEFANFMSQMKR